MSNILDVIGNDLKVAGVWIEKEAGVVLTEVETAADVALKTIWGLAQPIFVAVEPVVTAKVLSAIVDFLSKAEASVVNGDLAGIEQAFLMEAEKLGGDLLVVAQGLGSNLLQILIGLAKGKAGAGG